MNNLFSKSIPLEHPLQRLQWKKIHDRLKNVSKTNQILLQNWESWNNGYILWEN